MKKAAILMVIALAAGMMMSSCNKQVCPAYSQVDTEQTEPST